VALYLELAGIPWEPVFLDFMGGATRAPDWRDSVNAMGEAPVLETDGRRLTQSGAILTWLADRHDAFQPQSADDRFEALRWILFDNHKFTGLFATYRFLKAFAPKPSDSAVMTFMARRVADAYKIVERHLEAREFIVGPTPTIADLSLAGYVFYPADESGIDIASTYPSIDRWRQRIAALPRWKGPYDLMPGERIAPKW
jgi:glutathione S-transferase